MREDIEGYQERSQWKAVGPGRGSTPERRRKHNVVSAQYTRRVESKRRGERVGYIRMVKVLKKGKKTEQK